jgi:EAL domain-containing protein (putative c-di-GMP-specific phosphodiesterase class I)
MIKEAAFGLDESKRKKAHRVNFFRSEQREEAQRLIELELDLRTALAKKQLELYYQPQVDLASGELSGFEALLRWRHPKYGMVQPGEFIPAAENSGLIIPIGAWVIRESARQLADWRRRYPYASLHLSANLSVKQFFDKNLVRQVQEAIRRWKLPQGMLCLEITESLFIGDMEEAAAVVHQIKNAGASLMIDDFGTGYSSLYSVSSLPFDGIKIDRSFISQMVQEASCREVIRAIISLARNLRMCVVAEGAETAEQVEALRLLDCGFGQGYFFSKPLPAAGAEKMLEAMRPAGQRPV